MLFGLYTVAKKDVQTLENAINKKYYDLEKVKKHMPDSVNMVSAVLNDIVLLTEKLESRKKDLKRFSKRLNK